MECLRVHSIRHFIGLQWNLKVEKFLQDFIIVKADNTRNAAIIPERTIRSAVYLIKGLDECRFYLELTNRLRLLVVGTQRWSYEIIYAFAVVNDRAFSVKSIDSLKFLNLLSLDQFVSVEEVTFHCMVLVTPPLLISFEPAGNKCKLHTESQVYANGYCKSDGEIPDFTVDKAEELIRNEDASSVLKILAVEYLIKSITAQTINDIWKIAMESDLKILLKYCFEFLKKVNKIKQYAKLDYSAVSL